MIPTFKSDDEAERSFPGNGGSSDIADASDYDGDIALIELEGVTYEIIDTVTVDERNYIALLPYSEDDADSSAEFTILEIVDDPDDEENCTLKTVDDDELYDRIGEAFLEQFGMNGDDDYDEGDE